MIDIGISKLALIGVVALVVIGPEKLPRLARTLGALLGKAQRYVSDVKAEVNRSMELDELKKMKESMEGAAQEVQSNIESSASDFEKNWADVTSGLETNSLGAPAASEGPVYKHPGKRWRIKQGTTPNWYKAHAGIRTKAVSGAARVARFRPQKLS